MIVCLGNPILSLMVKVLMSLDVGHTGTAVTLLLDLNKTCMLDFSPGIQQDTSLNSDVLGWAQSPEPGPARPKAGLGLGFQWAWAWLKVQKAHSPGLKPGLHNQLRK
jgi:hypothetical protein